MRALPREIPTLSGLDLPASLAELVKTRRGLVPAVEILLASHPVRHLIRTTRPRELESILSGSSY